MNTKQNYANKDSFTGKVHSYIDKYFHFLDFISHYMLKSKVL
jgi:hypothetical protein